MCIRDRISSVLVKMTADTNVDQLTQRIKANVPGTTVITANELSRSVTDRISGFKRGFIAVDAIVWIMSLLTIAAIFSMIVNERQREIGLLRAMGSSRQFVFRLMLAEAVFLTAAGGIAGIFVGGAALFIFKAIIT